VSPQRKHALDTLLPGYASRPNPSPIKKQVQQQQPQQQGLRAGPGLGPNAVDTISRRSIDPLPGSATAYNDDATLASNIKDGWPSSSKAAAAASAEGVAASGLTGGGFILTDQQPSKPTDDVNDGRRPTYRSSRHSQGRTLLQQHIMMQHDLKQQQMLAAQQQARMMREQLEREQRQQQQQLKQQKGEQEPHCSLPVTKQEPQDMPGSPVPANEVLAAAAAAAGDHAQRFDSAHQQQQPSQQEHCSQGLCHSDSHLQQQQQQQRQQLPFELLLDQPPTVLTKAEHDRLLALPLPAALQQLLLLAGHLESCYSFLLQQHIQPRWGRLADMMQQLFPQVRFGQCAFTFWVGAGCLLNRCSYVSCVPVLLVLRE
jgi:hypothetical protein